jgi:hypothetical protein
LTLRQPETPTDASDREQCSLAGDHGVVVGPGCLDIENEAGNRSASTLQLTWVMPRVLTLGVEEEFFVLMTTRARTTMSCNGQSCRPFCVARSRGHA